MRDQYESFDQVGRQDYLTKMEREREWCAGVDLDFEQLVKKKSVLTMILTQNWQDLNSWIEGTDWGFESVELSKWNSKAFFYAIFFSLFFLVIEQKRRLKGRRGCGILFMADDTASASASASDSDSASASASPFCSCSPLDGRIKSCDPIFWLWAQQTPITCHFWLPLSLIFALWTCENGSFLLKPHQWLESYWFFPTLKNHINDYNRSNNKNNQHLLVWSKRLSRRSFTPHSQVSGSLGGSDLV